MCCTKTIRSGVCNRHHHHVANFSIYTRIYNNAYKVHIPFGNHGEYYFGVEYGGKLYFLLVCMCVRVCEIHFLYINKANKILSVGACSKRKKQQ